MESELEQWIEFSTLLARESGALIMRYYEECLRGAGPEVMRKEDRSPVTAADREAETLMRQMIESRYPEHCVMGEETGTSGRADSEFRWVLDPIDGTKSFVHGVPLFGTLIALLQEDDPILGIINIPATGELMVGARGRQTTVNDRPVTVRDTTDMADSTILFTDLPRLRRLGYGTALATFEKEGALLRGWGDCYGHFLVAAGRADVMFDPEMNLWDLAALKPCVEGAGGRYSDISGNGKLLGTSAISSNGILHEHVLRVLQREGGGT